MSCWDHIFNAWLFTVAEENGISIGRVNLDKSRVEDYFFEEAVEKHYERRHIEHE